MARERTRRRGGEFKGVEGGRRIESRKEGRGKVGESERW